jgi:N-glycosylase/DNA lyase
MSSRKDAAAIHNLVDAFAADAFVLERTRDNVDGSAPIFLREGFWYVVMGCLLTTQQRSTQGSAVSRFLGVDPFPLSLSVCHADTVEQSVLRTLTDFGGIRRTLTIAKQGKQNLEWLLGGGWSEVEQLFNRLKMQGERRPQVSDRAAEREAARYIDDHLAGFGPKQSRNLWQWLGLTRYEIPLDSRIAQWVNENVSFEIEVKKLGDSAYYESCLDRLQAACAEAGVLPCIFDAAAFNDENKAVPARAKPSIDRKPESKGATSAGYLNRNGQLTVRATGLSGTDHLQHERRCPNCQGGEAGLSLERELP